MRIKEEIADCVFYKRPATARIPPAMAPMAGRAVGAAMPEVWEADPVAAAVEAEDAMLLKRDDTLLSIEETLLEMEAPALPVAVEAAEVRDAISELARD
jgi:hypothetical protein